MLYEDLQTVDMGRIQTGFSITYQLQVLIAPNPLLRIIYLESLNLSVLDIKHNDIKFIEDDWESPTLGATGLGWKFNVCCGNDQFTYFQQMSGIDCEPVSLELRYDLERIAILSKI